MAKNRKAGRSSMHNFYFMAVMLSVTVILSLVVKFFVTSLHQRGQLVRLAKDGRTVASTPVNVQYSASQLLGDQLTDILTRSGESKAKMSYDSSQNMIVATFIDVGAIRFASNSAELSQAMKGNIGAAIEQITKFLLNNKTTRDKIESLEISGHSDPRFKQQFIDPQTNNLAAQSYNMDLSAKRALSVYQFIFNSSDLKLKHRQFMQQIASVSAFGHTQPVILTSKDLKEKEEDRKPASDCGSYSCGSSRRVEFRIRFKSKLTKSDLKSVDELVSHHSTGSLDSLVGLKGEKESSDKTNKTPSTEQGRKPASMSRDKKLKINQSREIAPSGYFSPKR
jgi:outer membrane protein OmpA-like peptidoglycan-associated protein